MFVLLQEDSNTECVRYVTSRRHVPNSEDMYRSINHALSAVIHGHPDSSKFERWTTGTALHQPATGNSLGCATARDAIDLRSHCIMTDEFAGIDGGLHGSNRQVHVRSWPTRSGSAQNYERLHSPLDKSSSHPCPVHQSVVIGRVSNGVHDTGTNGAPIFLDCREAGLAHLQQ